MNKPPQNTWLLIFVAALGPVSGASIVAINQMPYDVTQRSTTELDWIATCSLLGQSVDTCQQQSDRLKQLGYYDNGVIEMDIDTIKLEAN